MHRTRSLTGLLLLALTLGLVATGLATTSASAARQKLVQGVVVDGRGQHLDGVTVQAFDDSGAPAASAETYANLAPGGTQHGYFWLDVPRGVYTVKVAEPGYVPVTLRAITIERGHPQASLGEITLLRRTETSGRLADAGITTDDKGKVKVTVTPGAQKPTGDVQVREGSKVVGSAELVARARGEVTVTLRKLARGSHDLKVVYTGSELHQESTSSRLTLVVKAATRHRRLPNALAILG